MPVAWFPLPGNKRLAIFLLFDYVKSNFNQGVLMADAYQYERQSAQNSSIFYGALVASSVFAAAAFHLTNGPQIAGCEPDGDGGANILYTNGDAAHTRSVEFSKNGQECILVHAGEPIIIPVLRP